MSTKRTNSRKTVAKTNAKPAAKTNAKSAAKTNAKPAAKTNTKPAAKSPVAAEFMTSLAKAVQGVANSAKALADTSLELTGLIGSLSEVVDNTPDATAEKPTAKKPAAKKPATKKPPVVEEYDEEEYDEEEYDEEAYDEEAYDEEAYDEEGEDLDDFDEEDEEELYMPTKKDLHRVATQIIDAYGKDGRATLADRLGDYDAAKLSELATDDWPQFYAQLEEELDELDADEPKKPAGKKPAGKKSTAKKATFEMVKQAHDRYRDRHSTAEAREILSSQGIPTVRSLSKATPDQLAELFAAFQE